jgi:hypothetical protein
MIRLIAVAIGVAGRHGIAAGWRAFLCGWWWGRAIRKRRRMEQPIHMECGLMEFDD